MESEEFVTVKKVMQNGSSLILRLTEELNAMGLNRGDFVKVTLAPVNVKHRRLDGKIEEVEE